MVAALWRNFYSFVEPHDLVVLTDLVKYIRTNVIDFPVF